MASNPALLQFTDGASCKQWLETLPLTNVQAAQSTLTQQIVLVRQAKISPANLLNTLEALCEPVVYVQSEIARKYAAKSLPLDAAEAASWTKSQTLWQEFISAYSLCRDAHIKGDPGLTDHAALIAMRCLQFLSSAMFEYCRVYRQVPAELWQKLHQHYIFAEQNGFALAVVEDTSGPQKTAASCTTAYCQALLLHLANPCALSGRQMEFLARWVEKWSGSVGLSPLPLPPSAIPAVVVDLASSAGPTLAEGLAPLASMRYLDLEQPGRALRHLIAQLKQGQTPAQLGLGDDATQPGCENLLMLLYVQWCRAGTGRSEPRNPSAEKAQVCLGLHAAHYFISGRAFRAPGSAPTRQEQNDMAMFGHVSERTQQSLATATSSAVESWQLMNQSGSGFMCMLREPDAQLRIGHNQLVAVRRNTSKVFSLGMVQWLRIEESTELYTGVRLFPGSARAVAVRPANFNPAAGIKSFERGLVLPAVPPSTPITLILPAGWYQAGRVIEVHGDQKQDVKLVNVLDKGRDFERCTIAPVG